MHGDARRCTKLHDFHRSTSELLLLRSTITSRSRRDHVEITSGSRRDITSRSRSGVRWGGQAVGQMGDGRCMRWAAGDGRWAMRWSAVGKSRGAGSGCWRGAGFRIGRRVNCGAVALWGIGSGDWALGWYTGLGNVAWAGLRAQWPSTGGVRGGTVAEAGLQPLVRDWCVVFERTHARSFCESDAIVHVQRYGYLPVCLVSLSCRVVSWPWSCTV